jgi:hypothetical protein
VILLKYATSLGYESLKIFVLSRESQKILLNSKEGDETYEEFYERTVTACWWGEEYYHMWLGDENKTLGKNRIDKVENINLTNLANGVYYVEFAGAESHYWVWVKINNYLWYAGTYGGYKTLNLVKFDIQTYNDMFVKAMEGSMKDYEKVFQIEGIAAVSEVNFEFIEFQKSPLYA